MSNLGLQQLRSDKKSNKGVREREPEGGGVTLEERPSSFCSEDLFTTGGNTCLVPRLNSNKDLKYKSIIVMRTYNSHKHFLPRWIPSFIHSPVYSNTYYVPDIVLLGPQSLQSKQRKSSRVGLGKTEDELINNQVL